MFRNYLLVAVRNILKYKLYSVITIAGLAAGLASVMFIILFVQDELSYDKWLPGTKDLYRLELTFSVPGRAPEDFATVPFQMPAAMRNEIPEVLAFSRMSVQPDTVTAGNRQFLQDVQVVDPNFFNIVKLPFVFGDPSQALAQPESVVLTQTMARKYFGTADPIGRLLRINKGNCNPGDDACLRTTIPLTVTGILRDIPHNSQLSAAVVIPNTSAADQTTQRAKDDWTTNNHYAWLVLAPGARPETVLAKLTPIIDRALADRFRAMKLHLRGSQVEIPHLTRFTAFHLASSQYASNLTPAGSWADIYELMSIGLLLMLIACFNFMNLASARALLRAREIALRKTVGAHQGQLIWQFLGESVLTALMSWMISLSLVEILLATFDGFLQRPLALNYFANWMLLPLTLAISIAAGLISGSYPALILSRFHPALILHSSAAGRTGSRRLRSALVVLQFAISIGLGTALLVVFSQIHFARHLDMGFRLDHVVVVPAWRLTTPERDDFVQLLHRNPDVVATALSSDVAFTHNQGADIGRIPGQSESVVLNELKISPDFTQLYDIPVVAGRALSARRADDTFNASPTDKTSNDGHDVLLNSAAAARFGFTPQQIVGKLIAFNNSSRVRVVGVLSDFKFRGVREAVKPMIFLYDKRGTGWVSVRVKAGADAATKAFIDRTWHALAPDTAVESRFLDDSFQALYTDDERQGTLFGIFTGIAIVIACLGLFALAAFTAGHRTREIGIRKAFGARTTDVALLLLWQFSIPVLVANLLAWPVTAIFLRHWLQGFAYRIGLSPFYFVAAGVVALIIAWTTVGVHALRVARATPIHALRYE